VPVVEPDIVANTGNCDILVELMLLYSYYVVMSKSSSVSRKSNKDDSSVINDELADAGRTKG
jgi:hypothetical protein